MATYPVWNAGSTVTASKLSAGIEDFVYVQNQMDQLSVTTPANDTELFYALAASAKYEVELWLSFKTTGACDLKTAWAVPSGASGGKKVLGATDTAAGFTSRTEGQARFSSHGFTTAVTYQLDTSGLGQLVYERGAITTSSAGTFNFQWAQNASVATNLSREVDNYLKIRRIG